MNKINSTANVQFSGINIRRISQRRRLCQYETADMLSQNIHDVMRLTNNVSSKRMAFWELLAVNYNKHNFYRKQNAKEDSKLVNQVFSLIKNPKDIHKYIVCNFADSFQNVERILKNSKNKKERLEFVRRVNSDIFGGENPAGNDLIPQLLESPFCKQYIKNYKDIKSYLILHNAEPDAVKNLDLLIQSKKYVNIYDKQVREQQIRNSWKYANTDILNTDIYYRNFTEPAGEMVSTLGEVFLLTDDILKSGGDKYVLDIIKTTTDSNVDLRQMVVRKFHNNNFISKKTETNLSVIKDFVQLFNTVDSNKPAEKFVKYILKHKPGDFTIAELNEILAGIPSNKLNIFKENAKNIISKTNREERIQTLNNEITNHYFETKASKEYRKQAIEYGYGKKESLFKKTKKYLENYYNIFRYSLSKTAEFKPQELQLPVAAVKASTTKTIIERKKIIEPANTISNNSQADLREDVLSIIASKLSTKTYDKQKTAYIANLTKMRLGMLPEIFASVADTRKIDRTVGKRKKQAFNNKALDLYLKINGNNKKFINYLLKKRNVDGTRMFTINDIIAMLDKAEAKIAANKKANPGYRARDARRYYNHLYEAKIQQYGKLPRTQAK